ncbi:MAG: prolipoprotein diacylglyceryl transferase, partial [Clostridia bacterium]|nr:prolipoprotein diacylglyceryl transferase [Clostridia bacterium]
FPDNEANDIFHYGIKCFPTQLFEATALIVILLLILAQKNKFENYLILYSASRFFIEFLRGDERGSISNIFSPSQIVSIVLFLTVMCYKCFVYLKKVSANFDNNKRTC